MECPGGEGTGSLNEKTGCGNCPEAVSLGSLPPGPPKPGSAPRRTPWDPCFSLRKRKNM